MNQEELEKILHEKYDGYFRRITVTYVDYRYYPTTNKELIDTYVISWRPWKIKQDDDEMVMYSCTELLSTFVPGALSDSQIKELFTQLDNTKTVSPRESEILKGLHTTYVQAPPRKLMN